MAQNKTDPTMQAVVFRVNTARKAEKAKKTAKCKSSTGTHTAYAGFQTLVRSPTAIPVPATKITACTTTKATTPRYLPASNVNRDGGLASSTVTADGSRKPGRKPAVHRSVRRTPAVSATTPARKNSTPPTAPDSGCDRTT